MGALLGMAYALLLPPMQAPDEFAHFYRAYGISEGSCVAPALTAVPASVKTLVMAFPPNLQEERLVTSGVLVSELRSPLDDSRREVVTNEAADLYSCVPYLPEVIGISAGRLFGASPAAILYLGRFANLAAYLALVALALWQIPAFHLPLLAVALMPMALSQAASASWDGIAYGTAFFLFAYILHLARDPGITLLQRRHYLILAAAILLAGVCKTDAWLIPLLVMVPAARFGGSRRKGMAIAGAIALALLVIASWNLVNRDDAARWAQHIQDRQIYLSDNVAFLYHHPGVFLSASLRTWTTYGADFIAQIIGKLGWMVVVLPAWSIWLYSLLLVILALTDSLKSVPRLLCLAIVAVAAASIFIGMWCAETTRPHIATVLQGQGLVLGVQGRYFIPFVLPLLLAISGGLRFPRRWLLGLASLTIFTINAVALDQIHRTYYLTGETGAYENKLVRRAGSSPEDGKVFLVRAGKRHWVIYGNWLAKHGYNYPQDLITLTPQQFSAIPEGKVIGEP